MAKKRDKPDRDKVPPTSDEATAAVRIVKAFLAGQGATRKEARAANKVIKAYVREQGRSIAEEKKRLKAQGARVDKHIRKALKALKGEG